MTRWVVTALCLLTALSLLTAVQINPMADNEGCSQPAVDLSAYPWLYARQEYDPLQDTDTLSLIVVGDILLGRGVAEIPNPLGEVAPLLHSADIVFGNFESSIVAGAEFDTSAAQPRIILNSPTTSPTALRDAGFTVLGLANNHTLDYGSTGLAETADRLQMRGLMVVGAGTTHEMAYEPQIVEAQGLRLALFAFNTVQPEEAQSSNWVRADWDEARALEAIRRVRAQVNGVVVLIHWGIEYTPLVSESQQQIAKVLVEAGADMVVGSHPHVVQGTEIIKSSFIAYSVGNFVFDQDESETTRGLALRATFDRRGLLGVQALPIAAERQPRLLPPEHAQSMLERIKPPPSRVGFTCGVAQCQVTDSPNTSSDGIFWSGTTDLTGDGVPEIVRRVGSQVQIYEDQTLVYVTPPEWRIVDAALGDPNDDGRSEVMLALWLADANGLEWSQPYIVGYRRGEYSLLWGGRALFRPILEIEVGDLDGDRTDEVVVLEQRENGQQAISAWRWADWSFSLVWRSPDNYYRNLLLLIDPVIEGAVISVKLVE